MTERAGSFCSNVQKLLQNFVKRERAKGSTDTEIITALQDKCPDISFDGYYRRIKHIDTCQKLQIEPHLLTQAETRKFQKIGKRDQKRVRQSFQDLQKNGKKAKKSTRALFKEAIRKVDPIILRAGKQVVPKTTSKTSFPKGTDSTHHTALLENAGIIPQTLGEKPQTRVTNGKRGTISVTVDVARMYPSSHCHCRECPEAETCTGLLLYRERMQKVYAQ